MQQYSTLINDFRLDEDPILRTEIAGIISDNRIKIVVIDDDPTGIQTMHGCLFLTKWDNDSLDFAMQNDSSVFYVLTNSRSTDAGFAEKVNNEIVSAVCDLNVRYKFRLIFVSRSDSTLRGHFPVEHAAIHKTLRNKNIKTPFPVFFIPSFFEAGRFTLNNIHYLKEHNNALPVSESEFAKDNVFGYRNSHLGEYIIEKTDGSVSIHDIGFLSASALQNQAIETISENITALTEKKYIAVNATGYFDLQKFSLALLTVFPDNTALVMRTSSSLPKAISGKENIPLLTKADLNITSGTGIFIVGSHVKKTTQQLHELMKCDLLFAVEVDVEKTLYSFGSYLAEIKEKLNEAILKGFTPVLYTSRLEIRLNNKTERLNLGQKISEFLFTLIKDLEIQPSYVVTKGGITSHDVLTKGLEIESAEVAGQILTGVPTVRTASTHRFPNLPVIIFPGNVGDAYALKDLYLKLR
ncbi:four-carbon acid sugar kinase family protein [Saccharicrinis sp. FJH54]|uniref:four-carbon acid sugar kinase family protein n=1 Tax=Saccharicrinis sp. FJH54 TaxID=3344665 RepID=UPI0035D524EE